MVIYPFFAIRATAIAVAILIPTVCAASAEPPRIGVPSAVRPEAQGSLPGQDAHILHVGVDLFANEEITTGPAGQTHLLF